MLSDPYSLIAILFCALAALLIALCYVYEKVCELHDRTMRITRDAEVRFFELEEDLHRIRQCEARRRLQDERWSDHTEELCFVDIFGGEIPIRKST